MSNQLTVSKLEIKTQLRQIFKTNHWSEDIFNHQNLTLSPPKQKNFGNLSTNISLLAFSNIKENSFSSPLQLAQFLSQKLNLSFCSKIESLKPGFINFYFNEKFLRKQLADLINSIDKKDFGQGNKWDKKTVLFEFTDPNPFKIFHTGHLMNNIIGEALIKIIENQKAKVIRLSYQGDVGLHIAKCLYIWNKKNQHESQLNNSLEEKNLAERNQFLGQCYVEGNQLYQDHEEIRPLINQINKNIYQKKNDEYWQLYQKGRNWSLTYFDEIYQIINSHFDHYFFESEVGQNGLSIVKQFLGKVFKKSQNAIIFPGSKHYLHDRVFINSLGLPTYEAKDLGLFKLKKEKFPNSNYSFILTANETNEYFKVVFKALEFIYPDEIKKTRHLSHGLMKFAHSKMSSRTGNVIPAIDFINDLTNKASKRMTNFSIIDKSITNKKDIAKKIALATIKYALLKQNLTKNVIFDEKKDLSFEGNTGPYLLYTYVRTLNVLKKANLTNHNFINSQTSLLKNNLTTEEKNLIAKFLEFEEILEQACQNLSPHLLSEYLFSLSQNFNLLYNNLPILKSQYNQKILRLQLTHATKKILKKGLQILGIKTVEMM